jgi:crotonobetainyl-CoA:carnitine CoA-transferase CaiB-like acyl-CoA transferase
VANRESLTGLLESVFAGHEPEALLERPAQAAIPAGRVRSLDEVYAWERTRSQNLVVDVEHQSLGRIALPGSALRTFAVDGAGTETESTRVRHTAPPVLDADAIRDRLSS